MKLYFSMRSLVVNLSISVQMDRLMEVLEFSELEDLGFMGDVFTWRNHSHRYDRYIKERLDRAVGNRKWRTMYPAFKVINGEPRHSDHRPVILDSSCEPVFKPPSDPTFRFEAMWFQEEGCAQVVQESRNNAFMNGALCASDGVRQVADSL